MSEEKEYEVSVVVHRQSNRAWTTKVSVYADSEAEARERACAAAEDQAPNVDYNQFGESSVHYESEVESTIIKTS